MLHEEPTKKREQFVYACIDELVPQNHLLRKIDKVIDWSFIYDLVKEKYSPDRGRPSLDPVILIKIVLIQYLYGIRSMRQTIREIEVNLAYRWFLGIDMYEKVPHFSTFGKNYTRRFKGTDLFEQIFSKILQECINAKLVDPSEIFIDATHVKACANNKKLETKAVQEEALFYEEQLKKEINEDRMTHGKKALKEKEDDSSDFDYIDDTPIYKGSVYDVKKGIDVSEHQLEIDWSQLKNENLDYAYIRVGRRGYTEGGIFEDKYFERNLSGAKSIGLETGVYFFSQAINVSEAIEEANWVIDRIKDKDITLPVVFDWEEQKTDDSRTRGLDGKTVTDCAVAFCETVKNAGYIPCVYFYRLPGYYLYDILRLQQFTLWFALPCTPPDVTFPSFYYKINMWQYTNSAVLPGVPVECDLNYWFIPKEQS